MATIGTVNVRIGEEPRPCVIGTQETKALFHCWGICQHPFDAVLIGQTSGQVSYMTAIVELQNGQCIEVTANQVKFLDSAAKFNEYAWNDRAEESDRISEYDRGYSDSMYFKNTYSPQELENDNDENWND